MKYLHILCLLLLIPISASAARLNIQASYSLYTSENLKAGRGAKLSVDWHDTLCLYPWLSYEKTLLRFGGQEMADVSIYGGGLGIERKWWFVELGYYIPKPNLRPSYKEALWLEMNDVLQPSYSANYGGNGFEYKISPDLGFSIGAKIPIIKQWSLLAIYRWIKFEDVITCRFDDTNYWEVYHYRDFSGAILGIKCRW